MYTTPPQNDPAPSLVGTRILIVDDEKGPRESLRMILSPNHDVLTADSGADALEVLARTSVDLMTIDLNMPGMPGDQLARRLAEADPLVVPVLITGWDLKPDDARRAAFDFCVQKPMDDLNLVEGIVARAVQLHDRRAEER